MGFWSRIGALIGFSVCFACAIPTLFALDPEKALSQYSRSLWTQVEGLAQDSVRSIAQTSDGYLWLSTTDGLSRFDGYDFVTFTEGPASLPSNSVRALAAGDQGTLWIGTAAGLTRYRNHRFTTFTTGQGLPSNFITAVHVDHSGAVWVIAGSYLSRFENNKFTTYRSDSLLPLQTPRALYEDAEHTIWVAGVGGLVKSKGGRFVPILSAEELAGDIVNKLIKDRKNNLWIGGTAGVFMYSADGKLRRFTSRDGLPDNLVLTVLEDRDGNVWAGTNNGLARFKGGRFRASDFGNGRNRDLILCLFEDREGDLWVGSENGLNEFHDDRFTVFGRSEGFPSDQPTAVHQSRDGTVWIGYHGGGLVAFHAGRIRVYGAADGLSSNEIFSLSETRSGDLLIGTRAGLNRMHNGRFQNYVPPDPFGRSVIFNALEDHQGRIWAVGRGGVYKMAGEQLLRYVPGGLVLNEAATVLQEGYDGSIWAGFNGLGLLQINRDRLQHFTHSDGLGSDDIHALYQDPDGTLWIATFGAGLMAFRDGSFEHYTARDGLLSNNISHIEDDTQGSLWLSTTKGICQVSKKQLRDFSTHRISTLSPVYYGVEDGLRSLRVAPGYPAASGGTRTSDGRLWFPTSRGLAVIDPKSAGREPAPMRPILNFVDITFDGREIDTQKPAEALPGTEHIQFRYSAILLKEPERVLYYYKLEGLDRDWIPAGLRRTISFDRLGHGRYLLRVRAAVAGQFPAETSFKFEVLPHFYEMAYFWLLCASLLLAVGYGLYRLHLRQIRDRFLIVLDERTRIAREIHDTLAQGFVGISSKLDAIVTTIKGQNAPLERELELLQKMARYCVTDARRSVMDLRASALDDRDLPSAIEESAQQWMAGSPIAIEVEISAGDYQLPAAVEQNVLRIAQELVTNARKHATPQKIWIYLQIEPHQLTLAVTDDGHGFDSSNIFSVVDPHFGLIGIRERTERLGGVMECASKQGFGTKVTIRIPLSENGSPNRLRRERRSRSIFVSRRPIHS
jgi:ligand-binding sensor domain-containing protein/signal transduction histidine kinase